MSDTRVAPGGVGYDPNARIALEGPAYLVAALERTSQKGNTYWQAIITPGAYSPNQVYAFINQADYHRFGAMLAEHGGPFEAHITLEVSSNALNLVAVEPCEA